MNEGEKQQHKLINQEEIDKLFSQLTTTEVEDFYQAYQLWLRRQRVQQLQQELQKIQAKQAQNAALMQSFAPSAIALSAIAQLRFHGVEDVDMLDRMLERGEEWLDNTMQLLTRCEALNVIQGNYTQWCEHALEGAYEWMWSMNDAGLSTYFEVELPEASSQQDTIPAALEKPVTGEEVTEAQLLQKLMSEEGSNDTPPPRPQARITQPLPVITPEEVLAQSEAFMAQAQDAQTVPEDSLRESQAEPVANSQPEENPLPTTEIANVDNAQEAESETASATPAPGEQTETSNAEIVPQSEPAELSDSDIIPQPEPAELSDSEAISQPEPVEAADQPEIAQPVHSQPETVSETDAIPLDEQNKPEIPAADDNIIHSDQEVTEEAQPEITASTETEQSTADEEPIVEDHEDPIILHEEPVEQEAEAAKIDEEPLGAEPAQENGEEAASGEKMQAQWPYVYQETEDRQHTTETADLPTVFHVPTEKPEQPASTDVSIKPRTTNDSKPRGLFMRSLAKILGR
ncbi:hypothetical protein [Dictyobacter kobayashii]|uniref:Uncharacterized protein n=1 Tax=Dictyobacter kobayashii TaxID=2014872 RepID=A0A402AM77_9CHLR|nr:hypothetical protein [Dictyobacter kobayashii]GCE20223.1 hypothetical protein KDK_40230 [Dictyobacter kobayashii]